MPVGLLSSNEPFKCHYSPTCFLCVCTSACVCVLMHARVCEIISFNDKLPAFAQLSRCNTNNIQLFLLLLSFFIVTLRHKFELLSVLPSLLISC